MQRTHTPAVKLTNNTWMILSVQSDIFFCDFGQYWSEPPLLFPPAGGYHYVSSSWSGVPTISHSTVGQF